MGKSSMPAAPWKQFEARIERLKETNRYHNILWTTIIVTKKITTTLMPWQMKSAPCTFSPTCGARSWERPSQQPSCCKTSFIHIWPCFIFFGPIISIAKTKKIWSSPWCQRLLPGPVLKSLSVSLGIRLNNQGLVVESILPEKQIYLGWWDKTLPLIIELTTMVTCSRRHSKKTLLLSHTARYCGSSSSQPATLVKSITIALVVVILSRK